MTIIRNCSYCGETKEIPKEDVEKEQKALAGLSVKPTKIFWCCSKYCNDKLMEQKR